MRIRYVLLTLLCVTYFGLNMSAQSCPDGVSYQWSDMLTLFNDNGCNQATCHGGTPGSGGLNLTTYANFSTGGNKCGTEIQTGNTLTNIIDVGTQACAGGTIGLSMNTFTGGTVDAAELADIQAWVDAGVPEFCPPALTPDSFCGAIPLTVDAAFCDGTTTNGDNTGATTETGEPVLSCGFGGDGIQNTVWFSFVAPASGVVTVSTDFAGGTNLDTQISVYEYTGAACPNPDLTLLAEVGCIDDGGTVAPYLSLLSNLNVTPGQTYYVQVDGYAATAGTFCLEVTGGAAPCDAAPAYVDVDALATSATPILYCGSDTNIGLGANDDPAMIYIAFAPTGGGTYDVTTTDGQLYTSTNPVTLQGTTLLGLPNLNIAYIGITQAEIDASGGTTTLTFNEGAVTCDVDLVIDWSTVTNSNDIEQICPPPACDLIGNVSATTTCVSTTEFEVSVTIDVAATGTGFDITNDQNAETLTVAGAGTYTFTGSFTQGTTVNVTVTQTAPVVAGCADTVVATEADCSCFNNPPANDECANAQPLTINTDGTCTVVNTTNTDNSCATDSSPISGAPDASCTDADPAPLDIWFSVVAPADGAFDVTLNVVPGVSSIIELYDNCAGPPVAGQLCDNLQVTSFTGLVGGQTYFLRLWDFGSNDFGVHEICVSSCDAPPANDECANAEILTPGSSCVPVTGTVACATDSGVPACTDAATAVPDDDVWYQFAATTDNPFIQVTGSAGFDAVLEVFDACAGTSLACADATAGGGVEAIDGGTVAGITTGNTYLIRVYDFGTGAPATQTFDICVTETVGCDGSTCSNPSCSINTTALNDLPTVYADLAANSFTPATSGGSVTVCAPFVYTGTSGEATITTAPIFGEVGDADAITECTSMETSIEVFGEGGVPGIIDCGTPISTTGDLTGLTNGNTYHVCVTYDIQDDLTAGDGTVEGTCTLTEIGLAVTPTECFADAGTYATSATSGDVVCFGETVTFTTNGDWANPSGSAAGDQAAPAGIIWGIWSADPMGAYPIGDPTFLGVYGSDPTNANGISDFTNNAGGGSVWIAPIASTDEANLIVGSADCFEVGTATELILLDDLSVELGTFGCNAGSTGYDAMLTNFAGGLPGFDGGATSYTITADAGTLSSTTAAPGGSVDITDIPPATAVNITITDNQGCSQAFTLTTPTLPTPTLTIGTDYCSTDADDATVTYGPVPTDFGTIVITMLGDLYVDTETSIDVLDNAGNIVANFPVGTFAASVATVVSATVDVSAGPFSIVVDDLYGDGLQGATCGFGGTDGTITVDDGQGTNLLATFSDTGDGACGGAGSANTYLVGTPAIDFSTTGTLSSTGGGLTDNGDGTATFSPSTAGVGTYDVTYTFTDANGCTGTTTTTVTVGVSIDNVTSTTETCGDINGTATATVTTGTAPYTYAWNNGQTGATAIGLAAGSYTLTVTDANGCTATGSAVVVNIAGPTLSTSSTDASCGATDGSATVTPAGGTMPYTYLWVDGQTTATATGLGAGNYGVTVTDANGCTETATASVVDLAAPTLAATSPADASCTANDATATATPTGGTAPYSYVWSDGQTMATATGLASGTYTVTVTDGNGCSAVASVAVTDIAAPTLAATSPADASCAAGDATATATPTGGMMPMTYLWSNGQTAATATGLTSGMYTVTVTDGNGCTANAAVMVTDLIGPSIDNTSSTDASCGATDGSATVTASGGTAPYTYAWTGGQTAATATGLGAGNYDVTVTDANGCTATSTASVVDLAAPTLAATSPADASCAANDATATATPTGGTAPYTYVWSDNQTAATATGLASGTYTVTVTDDNGCSAVASVAVTDIVAPTLAAASPTDASCTAGDATATATPTGGMMPMTYLWSDGQTAATATGLTSGTYTVTVTDANGCTANASVAVTDIANPSVNASSTIETCGDANGTVTATPTGVAPFSYAWSSGQSTATVTGLSVGSYTVTVTDANGCQAIASAGIANIAGPSLTAASPADASCAADDATATATGTGGTAPLTYLWNDGQTTAMATGLASGTYTVTVTDANNCTEVASVTVTDIAAPTVAAASPTDTSCAADDATAIATPTGGVMPMTYLWSDGQTTATAIDLSSGNYTVTITDANGCTANAAVTVNDLIGPAIDNISSTDASCGANDGTATVVASGGTAPYTYLWSDGQTMATATGLTSGNYGITVTDANGCPAVSTANVSDSGAPTVDNTSSTNASCGGADGTATVAASGGTPPYTYLWDDAGAQTAATATGLAPGTYNVTVNDGLGCSASSSVIVAEDACVFVDVMNDFSANDPCACNNDQSANGAGDGTFSETVTVTGPPGLIVQASVASSGMDIPAPAAFTEVAPGRYVLTFNHVDRLGYQVFVEFSSDGGNTFDNALNAAGNQLTISNVCAYPVIAFTTALPNQLCADDAAINLILVETSTDVTFSPLTTTVTVDGGGAAATPFLFSPAVVGAGAHTVTATYDYSVGTGMGGTLANPAIPINACPVSFTQNVTINALPTATAACSENGLISLSNIVAPSGDLNDLTYSIDGTNFGTSSDFTVTADGMYIVTILDNTTGCTAEVTADCLLPLDLIAFTGTVESQGNYLKWTTLTEENSDAFIVEYSTDALAFTEVGRVEAAGNSTNALNYNFLDENTTFGIHYYRLQMLDLDGSFEYSEIITLERRPDSDVITFFPNPVEDKATVIISAPANDNDAKMIIADVLGRTVLEFDVSVLNGDNTFEIDLDKLSSGMYVIYFDSRNKRNMLKFIKK